MHHQMAFDSAGLVRSAQNRLGEAPRSRVDAGKEHERTLDRMQIKDTQGGKKNTRILTTNHNKKMAQNESFRV